MLQVNIARLFAITIAVLIAVVSGLDLSTEGICGEPVVKPNLTIFDSSRFRIIGGTPAVANSWPWSVFVSLTDTQNQGFFCTGSIIASQWIITAAHCVASPMNDVTVQVGIHNRRRESNPVKADLIVRHSAYNPRTQANDIALLRLSRPLQFNSKIRPICLPDQDNAKASTSGIATGWGVFDQGPNFDLDLIPDVLLQVKLPIRNVADCRLGLNAQRQICAGDPNTSSDGQFKDTCFGDSGGPLFMQPDRNKLKFELVGLTSFGGPVCDGNGAYTRVFAYTSWVVDAIRNNGPTKRSTTI